MHLTNQNISSTNGEKTLLKFLHCGKSRLKKCEAHDMAHDNKHMLIYDTTQSCK